jgi:hypothetical protein
MAKVTLRVPVQEDGAFDIAAQRDLAREYIAISDAVQSAEESLATLVELKPRADLPKDAANVGPQPGQTISRARRRGRKSAADPDADVARERLREIESDPHRLVSGSKLKAALDELLA